jgi:hypothetical protein
MWTLPALTYLALVDSFVEPDPAFQPTGKTPASKPAMHRNANVPFCGFSNTVPADQHGS